MRYQITNQKLVNPADLKKTTILINRRTVRRLEELGSHADTFDKIFNRLIDYDIKLYGPQIKKSMT